MELEQFTELHTNFRTKMKNAFLKILTQLATQLAQKEKKERIREKIAACVDPTKVYLIQDKTIEKRVKALIIYVQKEKGNLVQVIGFSILKPVLDSGLIPILANNFNKIVLIRSIKINALAFGSGTIIVLITSQMVPFGIFMVAGTMMYFSLVSESHVDCGKMFLELPGATPVTKTVFLPEYENKKDYLLYSNTQEILKYVKEDGSSGIVVKSKLKSIKMETLGEETKPTQKVVRQPKTPPRRNKQMKTMSELIKEGNNVEFDIDKNLEREAPSEEL